MSDQELSTILDNLRNLTSETEVVEFKEAKDGYDLDKIGKYFSALSNEANLKGKPHAWLVFGVENKCHKIVGSRYRSKFPEKSTEADSWDTVTFLNKAKLTIKGRITRTTIILLGKEESEHFLSPAESKIRWLLKDSHGNDRDYLIVGCPLLLAVDKIYLKIRNSKYRYLKDGTLFPEEIDKYEPFTIREAINNCIAHQDYSLGGRINVIEIEDQLIFTNLGKFIPGDVEKVVRQNAPEERYRNPFLATAMFNLKMVDTAGGGIRKMFNFQRQSTSKPIS